MVRYTKYIIKKNKVLPIHLILEVTSVCNARCLTCFNWKKTDYKKPTGPSLEQLEKISRSLNNLLWFSLTGGEPFLRKDLADIVAIFVKNNKPENITMPTNCLMPNRITELAEKILNIYKKNFVITLSLDGIGNLHDKIRGVENNFQKFLETYKSLKELQKRYKNLHIGVNTTINSLNKDYIKEIGSYVEKNLKVESHTLELIRGCSRDSNVKPPTLDYYIKNKKILQDFMKKKSYYKIGFKGRLLKAAKLYYHDYSIQVIKKRTQVVPCVAGRLSAVIDCNLNVYPCELYKKYGNLKDFDYNFRKLWFSNNANKVRKEIIDKYCYCTHSCFQFVTLLFNLKAYPKIAKYLF